MAAVPEVLVVLGALSMACATTADIRQSPPTLIETFGGTQQTLASCVAEQLVGQFTLTPIIRSDPPRSIVSATGMSMGTPILFWEMSFDQVTATEVRVELRTRKTAFDRYDRDSPMWQALIDCSRRGTQ